MGRNFEEDLATMRREYPLEQTRGTSFEADLAAMRAAEGYQPTVQPQTQIGDETEMHRALRELGTPDLLNDYVLEPFLRFEGNLGIGFWDSFARKWMNVPALLSRGVGMTSEAMLGGQSMFTDAANWLNDTDAAYVKASEAARRGVTGTNPTFVDDIAHGAGTSLGHAVEGLLAGGLALGSGAAASTANMIRFLTAGMTEAATEAGNTASEVYAQDKSRGNDAFKAGMYSLGVNAPLDLVSGYLGAKFSNWAGTKLFPDADDGIKWYTRNFLTSLAREETEELTQEPRQQAVETAVKNMFKSKDMSIGNFLGNLGTEGSHILFSHTDKKGNYIPSYVAQVAPTTIASTLLTSALLAPFELSGLTPKQAEQQRYAKLNEIFSDLQTQRDELQTRINDISNFYTNDAEQDLRTATELDELHTQLQDLNDVIDNFWGGSAITDNPVQDDAGFDLFADIHNGNGNQHTATTNDDIVNTRQNTPNNIQTGIPLGYQDNPNNQEQVSNLAQQSTTPETLIENTGDNYDDNEEEYSSKRRAQINTDDVQAVQGTQEAQAAQPVTPLGQDAEQLSSSIPQQDSQQGNQQGNEEKSEEAEDSQNIAEDWLRLANNTSYNQTTDNETAQEADTEQSLYDKAVNWVMGLLGNNNTGAKTGKISPPVGNKNNIGTIRYKDSNKKGRTLTIKSGEFSDDYANEKQYFGRYLEATDEEGNVVARYSPYTRILQMADNVQDADIVRKAIINEAEQRGNEHLRNFGYFDNTGRLADDGNEDFRNKHRARLDTNLPGSSIHPNNLRQSAQQRIDTRTKAQQKADAVEERRARKRVENDIVKKLEKAYDDIIAGKSIKENPIEGIAANTKQLYRKYLTRKHRNTRNSFRRTARATAIGYQALAHAYGMKVEEFVKSRPFDAISYLQAENDERINNPQNNIPKGTVQKAQIQVVPSYIDKEKKYHPEQLIMILGREADPSSALHEFGHGFLTELREVATTANDLPQDFRQDWLNLTKWLGVSDIDFTTPHSSWTDDQKKRWQNAQEKWAVGLEKYFAEGKAPSTWLKGVFNKFKTWMAHIYGNAKNIRYMGEDKQFHSVEITPEVRKFYDNLFKDIPFVPNEEARQARLAKLKDVQQGAGNEVYYNQISPKNQGSSKFNLPFDPDELRTESGLPIDEKAKPSEMIVTPYGSLDLGYIPENVAEFPSGSIRANVGSVIHAEKEHGKQIRGMGYDNAKELLLDVLNNYSEIRRGTGKALLLSAQGDAKHSAMGVVELVDDNGIYRVKTLRVTRDRYLKNKQLLFTRSEPHATGPDSGLTFSSEHTQSQGKSELYARQSSNLNESLGFNGLNVNTPNAEKSRIKRSNNTFVTREDIERYDQLSIQGTPHIIIDNQFGLEYIGTGEGHQSYAWGLYFAQNPKVAETYRRIGKKNSGFNKVSLKLSNGKTFTFDDLFNQMEELRNTPASEASKLSLPEGVSPEGIFSAIKEFIYQYDDKYARNPDAWDFSRIKSEKLSELENLTKQPEYAFQSSSLEEAIRAINNITDFSVDSFSNGNMYFADIPENDVLLDWDTKKQPPKVKKAIKKVLAKLYDMGAYDDDVEKVAKSKTGEELYQNLRDALEPFVEDDSLPFQFKGKPIPRSDMAASLLFNQAGIPGLRYFDAGSRGDKQGTHNFVIWNTDMIKLLGLSKDSDEDAKQYFKKQQANQSSSAESYAQIGKKHKADMEIALTKALSRNTKLKQKYSRDGKEISAEERTAIIKNAIDEIEKLGEKHKLPHKNGNPKLEKLAFHWFLNGNIILPEDNYKILDAIKISERYHLDPMNYSNPNEILAKYSIQDIKDSERVDPDTVKEFSNKVDYGNGITVYKVANTKAGQLAVRRIIDTHWGKGANPWCLTARVDDDSEELETAWDFWNDYDSVTKRIAFQNGKLRAFCASDDGKNQWWNSKDKAAEDEIPYIRREDNKTIEYGYDEKTGESRKISEILPNGTELGYYPNGNVESKALPDKDKTTYHYYENGKESSITKNGYIVISWYRNGVKSCETLPDGTILEWYENRNRKRKDLPNGTRYHWYESGLLRVENIINNPGEETYHSYIDGIIEEGSDEFARLKKNKALHKDSEGNWRQLKRMSLPNMTSYGWYDNGNLESAKLPDGSERTWWENGNQKTENLPGNIRREWYENGNPKYERLSYRESRYWYENGNRQSETLPNGGERSWYENGQIKDFKYRNVRIHWHENGNLAQKTDGEKFSEWRENGSREYDSLTRERIEIQYDENEKVNSVFLLGEDKELTGKEAEDYFNGLKSEHPEYFAVEDTTDYDKIEPHESPKGQRGDEYVAQYKTEHPDKFITPDAIERFDQIVYHGTNNIIWNNRFDLAYVGSSEGAAAYGFGAYFAQNKAVAETYRKYGEQNIKILAPNHGFGVMTITFQDGTTEKIRDIMRADNISDKKAIVVYKAILFEFSDHPNLVSRRNFSAIKTKLLNTLASYKNEEEFDSYIKILEQIKDVTFSNPRNGNLYQFDIPEDHNLLDWDAPLDKQPENIKKGIRKILAALDRRGFSKKSIYNIYGRDIFNDKDFIHHSGELYDAIVDVFEYMDEKGGDLFDLKKKGITRSDARTSWLFNKYGIHGHHYLDKGSRDSGHGTNNYVIWNMDKVTMTGISDDSDELARKIFYDGGTQQISMFDNNGTPSEIYNQFISVKATERLAEQGLIAQSTGTTETLERAKELDAKHMPVSFIWRETGWIKGKDGHWRTEIPDGEIYDTFFQHPKSRTVKLKAFYKNPVLYVAYPELADMPLKIKKFDYNDNTAGYYDEIRKTIAVSQKYLESQNYDILHDVLIHEIQHAIQNSEGWEAGSELSREGRKIWGIINRLIHSMPHELQDKIVNAYNAMNAMKNGNTDEVDKIVATMNKAQKARWAKILDYREKFNVELKKYESVAGEVEARNTGIRRNFDMAKRRNTPPTLTEDTPRSKQILKHEVSRQASSNKNSFLTPEKYDQLMYHGTRHILYGNGFDLQHIGTGQGAQSYGYGAYLAQKKDVGQFYRQQGAPEETKSKIIFVDKNGKKFFEDDYISLIDKALHKIREEREYRGFRPEYITGIFLTNMRALVENDGTIKGTREYFKDLSIYTDTLGQRRAWEEILEHFMPAEVLENPEYREGNLYLFDGPEDDVLLNWDVSMREQPAEVLDKLKNSGFYLNDQETGEELYWRLTKDEGDAMRASMRLNELGIPGLRYFDNGSRDVQNGTHNFVIWNTDTLRLLGLTNNSDEDAQEYFHTIDYNNARIDSLDNDSDVQDYSKGDYMAYMSHIDDIANAHTDALDNRPDIERYNQVIGEKGAKSIDSINGNNKMLNALQMAKKMNSKGVKPRTIKRATGWELGTEGKWKYEIQDGKLHNPEGKQYLSLRDFYENQQLFTAYPSFNDINVAFDIEDDMHESPVFNETPIGYFDKETLTFHLQRNFKNHWKFIDKLPETDYRHDEVQAIKSWLVGQLQELIQSRENFAMARSLDWFSDRSKPVQRVDDNGKLYWTAVNERPERAVKHSAGNIEVQNVQARTDVSPELRREILLSDTEPVAKNEQIVTNWKTKSENYMADEYGNALFDAMDNVPHSELYSNHGERYDQIGKDRKATSNAEIYHQTAQTKNNDVTRSTDDFLTPEAKAQMKAVRKQYEGTDMWLKAPNGEKSNLNEHQWLTVRTPAFKEWFGDWEHAPKNASKIVDENGEPLVVWHGTNENFSVFDRTKARSNMDIQGMFFSPYEIDAGGYGENLRAFYLNIKNPASEAKGYKALNKFKGQNYAGVKAREYLVSQGFDGVNNGDEEFIAFYPEQIKSATNNRGTFDSHDPEIYHQTAQSENPYDNATRPVDNLLTPEARRQVDAVRTQYQGTPQWLKAPNGNDSKLEELQWLLVRTPNFKQWFGDWENNPEHASKILDENGEPKVVYHGTGRADRIGGVFRSDRATSGPMAFFTDNKEIAENYSKNKADTSLSREGAGDYHKMFFVEEKVEGRRKPQKIFLEDYWYYLPYETKRKIAQIAPTITRDYDNDYEIISKPNNKMGTGGYELHIREAKGNHLKALIAEWLDSANLFNEEEKFLDVLKLVGLDNVKYLDPYYREEAVYPVFMNMRNPFNTSDISESDLKSIRRSAIAAERFFDPNKAYDSDAWDKSSVSPMDWLERLEDDIKENTTHVWTSIPDFVTNRLKKLGYDGIQDTGGKYHTEKHNVYIPFKSTQIKSSTKNNGNYKGNNPEIYHQTANGNSNTDNLTTDSTTSLTTSLHTNNLHTKRASSLQTNSDIRNYVKTLHDNPFVESYSQIQFNDKSETLYRNSYGREDPKQAAGNVKRTFNDFLKGFKGDFPLLAGKEAKDKDFTAAREILRIMNRNTKAKAHMTMLSLYDSLRKLNPEQFDIFSRMMMLNDIHTFAKNNPDVNELPLGYDREGLLKDWRKYKTLAEKDKDVVKAIKTEYDNNNKARNDLINIAKELGLVDLAKKIKSADLFLVQYANILDKDSGFNTNYVEATAMMRNAMLQDFEKLLALKKLEQKGYDIRSALEDEYGKNWDRHIPKGYSVFNPLEGNFITSAASLQDEVLKRAFFSAMEPLGMSREAMNKLYRKVAGVVKTRSMVMPTEIVKTLESIINPIPDSALTKFAQAITSPWKKHVLYFPTRAFKYNLRNLTGDLDAVLAGDPTAVRYVPQALKELYTAYYGDGADIPQELKEFQARGGALTVQSVQELGDYREMKKFNALINELSGKEQSTWKNLPRQSLDLLDKVFNSGIQNFSDFREQWLRYAAYLDYLQQMRNNNGVPRNFGASVREEVMAIDDIRDRAFKLANELLGAYDQVSESGKQLRKALIPFYSWIEVNAKRYVQLMKNGLTEDDFLTAKLPQIAAAQIPGLTYKLAKTWFLLNFFSLLVSSFNHLFFPEDEEELPPEIQAKPHITLGHDDKGNIRYFSQVGAYADALEWLSLDTFRYDVKRILNGQETVTDWLGSFMTAPLNKVFGGLSPFIKTPIEVGAKVSFYPDMFHPRPMRDRLRGIAQSFGLSWPYKAAAYKMGTGETYSNWDEFRKLFIYLEDAEYGAYNYARSLVRQYKEIKLGEKTSFSASETGRSNAMRKFRAALRLNDKAEAGNAIEEYIDMAGTRKSAEQSINNMNPLHGLKKEYHEDFNRWMSKEDRVFFDRAMGYYDKFATKALKIINNHDFKRRRKPR